MRREEEGQKKRRAVTRVMHTCVVLCRDINLRSHLASSDRTRNSARMRQIATPMVHCYSQLIATVISVSSSFNIDAGGSE